MMRFENKVKYLSLSILALLLVWALGEFFAPERVTSRSESASLLKAKIDDVKSIELASGATLLKLAKTGGTWALIEGQDRLPILVSRVDSLLASLAKTVKRRPVAAKKDAWAKLGLEDDKAKLLRLSDEGGKTLLELRTGGYGATGSEIYARFGADEASYTIDASIASWLSPERSSWLDRRLFGSTLETKEVEAFSLKADLKLGEAGKAATSFMSSWRFARAGEGWKSGTRELDSVMVESALRAFVNLEAVDLATTPPGVAFAKIGASLSVETAAGRTRLVEIGAVASEGRYWARVSEDGKASPLYFQLSAYSLGLLLKDEAAFARK